MAALPKLHTQTNGFASDSIEAKFLKFEERIAELEKKLAEVTSNQNASSTKEKEPETPSTAAPAPESTNGDNPAKPAEPKTDEKSTTPEVERYATIFKEWDDEKKDYKETPAQSSSKQPRDEPLVKEGRVLTFRKTLSDTGLSFSDYEIDIEDKRLIDELKSAYDEVCPGNDRTWSTDKQTVYFPFRTIIWCYDQLERRGKAEEGDDEAHALHKADIRQLLQFVRETPHLADYFKNKESTPNQIAFKYIWTLFPLGTEFVSSQKFLNTPQLFKVGYEPDYFDLLAMDPATTWSVDGWIYDHTGTDWVRAEHVFEVSAYEREKPINTLDFYPLKYYVDGDNPEESAEKLRADRIKEGKKFVEYCELEGAKRMRAYNDTVFALSGSQSGTLFTQDDASSRTTRKSGFKRPNVRGDVIIDSQSYYQQFLELPLGDSIPSLYFDNEPMIDKTVPYIPEGDWVRFCPPRFFGFIVKEKVTVQLKIGALGQVTPKDTGPFDLELQLAQDSKDLLRALVENHFNQKAQEQQMDIIAGKGNSLVILLHGGPGLGKTLTAETLAKATGKPLLTANVADIGVAAESAESKLERHFERAARWDAILLIDEADAFLEERRENTSPDQNALVTVMLRILEYYNGIIILTTNRLLALDPAVQSRIHLALYFDNLPSKNLRNIFRNLLDRFNVDAASQERLEIWFEVLSQSTKMNGREIRNLVHSAIALARSKDQPVTKDDFNTVLTKLRGFHDHLSDKFAAWKARNAGYLGR